MADSTWQAPCDPPGVHLLLYDGVCGLCSRILQFVLARDRQQVFSFASLQSTIGQSIAEQHGMHASELSTFFVVTDYQTVAPRVLTRSDAAIFVACALGRPWTSVRLLRFVPRSIRDRVYDAVARRRYRVFGRYDRCLVPSPELRHRFIDLR